MTLEGYHGGVSFLYVATPSIMSVLPSSGPLKGGSAVTVIGSNLDGSNVQCRFGAAVVDETSVLAVSSSTIVCFTPRMIATGKVAVDVTLNGGADFTASDAEYMYVASATVESVKPSRGLTGVEGQVVTVVGEHFVQTQSLSCGFGDAIGDALFL